MSSRETVSLASKLCPRILPRCARYLLGVASWRNKFPPDAQWALWCPKPDALSLPLSVSYQCTKSPAPCVLSRCTRSGFKQGANSVLLSESPGCDPPLKPTPPPFQALSRFGKYIQLHYLFKLLTQRATFCVWTRPDVTFWLWPGS